MCGSVFLQQGTHGPDKITHRGGSIYGCIMDDEITVVCSLRKGTTNIAERLQSIALPYRQKRSQHALQQYQHQMFYQAFPHQFMFIEQPVGMAGVTPTIRRFFLASSIRSSQGDILVLRWLTATVLYYALTGSWVELTWRMPDRRIFSAGS